MNQIFLIASLLLLGITGNAAAAEQSASMNQACWNLHVGSVWVSDAYVLGVLSERHPSIAGDIRQVFASMSLSAGQRDMICKKIEAIAQTQ